MGVVYKCRAPCILNREPVRNPRTRTRGTGMARVEKTQPVPLPLRTLPATCVGSKTLDNPYKWVVEVENGCWMEKMGVLGAEISYQRLKMEGGARK